MKVNNTTTIRTFKVKDLKPKLLIPKHQRFGIKSHINDLGESISEIGFNSSLILFPLPDGFYSLENGGQRWRTVEDYDEQEVHCIICAEGTDRKRLFTDTNQLAERLKDYDVIRHHANLKTLESKEEDTPYEFVWNYVYNFAQNEEQIQSATNQVFSHASIKRLFFSYVDEKSFERGLAKNKTNQELRLSIYNFFSKKYLTALKQKAGYDKLDSFNHLVTKTALIVLIEHIIKRNKDWDLIDIFNDVVDFGVYIDLEMDKELNTTKDNVLVFYKKYAKTND